MVKHAGGLRKLGFPGVSELLFPEKLVAQLDWKTASFLVI
jgi:hypothetical protein